LFETNTLPLSQNAHSCAICIHLLLFYYYLS